MSKNNQDDLDNPLKWVDNYGDYLYNYAFARIRDKSTAEELVQETFLSALKKQASFSHKSSFKTWLTSILKNKIIDHFRKTTKSAQVEFNEELYNETEIVFYQEGTWKDFWNIKRDPILWKDTPLDNLEKKEFWDIFHQCLDALPDQLKAIFTLREMEDLPTEKICKELNISSSNIWVIMHRSRKQLRRCLEINWYGGKLFPRNKI